MKKIICGGTQAEICGPHERYKSQVYFTVRIGEGQVQTRKRMPLHLSLT